MSFKNADNLSTNVVGMASAHKDLGFLPVVLYITLRQRSFARIQFYCSERTYIIVHLKTVCLFSGCAFPLDQCLSKYLIFRGINGSEVRIPLKEL